MEVFIVRPFGTKQVIKRNADGSVKEVVAYDFEKVHAELIQPALTSLGLDGGTTARIFAPGEIREDMFSELLLADIVIADISIHNANVFYELGIRNALRDRLTVLIKCPGFDDSPFDIIGYRYVSYNKDNPTTAIDDLKAAITAGKETMRRDSPVFNLLPGLEVPDTEKFYAVPPDFTEEANAAFTTRDSGKLTLMVQQASLFEWKIPAMRLLGTQLYRLQAYKSARSAWETVAVQKPDDCDASNNLSTIYQRLAEQMMKVNPAEAELLLQKSDNAIERLLSNKSLTAVQRADAYALKGRNAKTRWIAEWSTATVAEQRMAALASIYWKQSLANYELGFYTNLNHCYSGINALGLLTIIVSLADDMPDNWALPFDDPEEAREALNRLKRLSVSFTSALKFSIEAEQRRLQSVSKSDVWLDITHADLITLTSTDAKKISFAYNSVIRRCDQLQKNAIIRQLQLYQTLNILPDNITAAMAVTGSKPNDETDNYYILFTGHMIDTLERKEPRFPPEQENDARKRIAEAVQKIIQEQAGKEIFGIAGGACGGDILFQEVCLELGVKTELYLALPKEEFIAESVAFANSDWVERFNKLYAKLPCRILTKTKQIKDWARKHSEHDFWSLNNLWMLYNALANDTLNMSLIALWDGKEGGKAGGTDDMVKEVKKQGGSTVVIPMPIT